MTSPAVTILIVDDEVQNRRLFEALLRPEGYLTLTAASGEEALAAIAQRAPDLILLDIMMPGLDGYQVARMLKADPATSHIPIIMVTAEIDSGACVAALNAGAEEFLTKPVDRAELWLRVRNLLRLKTLGDRLQKYSSSLEQEVQARTAELQRFRTAMDATVDGISMVNRTTMRYVEVNATACSMFGYTREEFFEMTPTHLGMAPLEQIARVYDTVIAGLDTTELTEIEMRRKDGSKLQVEIRRHAHRSGADWIIVGVMRDITERKQTEAALRVSDAEFHNLAEAMPQIVWTTRPDGWTIYFNQRWMDYTGLTLEESKGHGWNKPFHPDDQQRAWDAWQQATGEGSSYSMESRLRRADGEYRWWLVRGVPQKDAMGNILKWFGTCTDIHDLKLAEMEILGTNQALRESEIRIKYMNRVYAVLSGINALIVRARDRDELYREACRIAVEHGGFRMCWIGIVDRTLMRLVPVASAGADNEMMTAIKERFLPSLSESPALINSMAAQAIAHNKASVSNDTQNDPKVVFSKKFIGSGVRSMAMLPLIVAGEAVGILALYASEIEFFHDEEMKLLSELAGDIAFALEHIEKGEKLVVSELRFRQMSENIRDVFFLIEANSNRVLYISPVYEEIWGRSCEGIYAHPESWTEAIHPDDRASTCEKYQQGMAAGTFEHEYRIVRPDGSIRAIKARAFPVRDDAGKLVRIAIVAEDVTERKRDQDALRELNAELEARVRIRTAEVNLAREEAEQANQAKSTFLASMSHEIRTPMNGVIGMIDVLHQSGLKGEQVEMVDLIRDSADSLLTIINDILDLSKIEAGKADIQNEPVQLTDLVEKVCAMLAPMAAKRGSRITVFVDPAIPCTVAGDEGRLRQVLVNLTGNAIKFSGGRDQPGKISVRAELVERSAQGATVDLIVADNGIGMDEATLGVLFKPFSQADASTTRRFGGTGLGLAISGFLVSLMDGEFSVRSVPGQGSTFTVRFRFAVLEDAVTGEDTPRAAEGLRCRIVGGDPALADDLDDYLAHAGAVVERSPDLHAAGAAERAPGLSLWLILPGPPVPALAELRALSPARPGADTRFIVLGRGRRHHPRVEETDLVRLDVDPLFRRTLFKALALASGRIVEEAANHGRQLEPVPAPSRDEAPLQRRSILVAEDNETNRKVILHQLQLIGFAPDIVADGRAALETWRGGDYALLLTDLHMPEMDGYALAAAIRAEEGAGRRIPIIALSANALRDEALRCRAAGMDAYLTKPVRLEQLKGTIEAWLSPTAEAKALRDITDIPGKKVPAADLSTLVALVGDDPAAIEEILQSFRKSAAKSSGELNLGVRAGSVQAVAQAAHKLKSAARSIGAMRLGEICDEFEQVAEAGKTQEMSAMLPPFQIEMDSVNRFLDSR